MQRETVKKTAKLLGKIAFTVLVVAWLLHKSDRHAIWHQLRTASLPFFLLMVASVVVNNFAQVLRWLVLVRRLTAEITFGRLLRFHMIALFFQSFLPSSMSVEIVKGYLLARLTEARQAYGSVVFGKFMGMFVQLFFFFLIILLRPGLVLHQAYTGKLIWIVAAFLAVAAVVFSKKLARLLFGRLAAFGNNPWVQRIIRFRDEVYNYRSQPGVIVRAALLSVPIFLASSLTTYFSFRAVGFQVPVLSCLVNVTIVSIFLMLPISLNGIGLRESILLLLFRPWHLGPDILISSSILNYAIIYTFYLLGGPVYLFSGIKGVKLGQEKESA